uniref:Uncharacterized protein n=1 Tax=Anguilla anguilla TaxID=7936 RepID=A0A0E9V348_ANGAN
MHTILIGGDHSQCKAYFWMDNTSDPAGEVSNEFPDIKT